MTLCVNGPLVPTREHATTQLACPGQLLLMMRYDDARNRSGRPLRRLHYDILGGHLDGLLLQLQLEALLVILRRRIRLLLLLDHVVQALTQRRNVRGGHVLELVHVDHQLVPPCEGLVAHLKERGRRRRPGRRVRLVACCRGGGALRRRLEDCLYFTNIGLLASVDAHVDGQLVLARQSLAADGALERFVGGCRRTDRNRI